MLTTQDKEWVKELMGAQSVLLTKAFTENSKKLEASLTQIITESISTAIDSLRLELVEVMKSGFAACATATEMAEVKEDIKSIKAHLGSLEQRFTWMQGVMVTKDYLDDRMKAYGMLEDVKHKQQSQKTARLVQILHTKKRMTRDEANVVLALAPHPQKLLS